MSKRIYNFSAGPAVLPEEVLRKAEAEFLNYKNNGMSIMEMSHRSKAFEAVHQSAKSRLKRVLGIPDNYSILFLQGGASLQFSMVPINLATKNGSVDVVNTGSWTKKAIKEFKRETNVNIVASSEDKNFSYIPDSASLKWNSKADFSYITSNNTIAGTQWKQFPKTENALVADMSSDILSRPLNVADFGLIFAGAQKNMGPSGVTLVIIDNALAERCPDDVPTMLQYRTHINNDSLYNTPNTFGIYMIDLVLEWIEGLGGLEAVQKRNEEKANRLINAIQENPFYYSPTKKEDVSPMNVVFRITGDKEDLEAQFAKDAEAAGLSGLKGHRSVGGLRASIYNAQSQEAVQALVDFMDSFSKKHSLTAAGQMAS